jgi:hypothetical protein
MLHRAGQGEPNQRGRSTTPKPPPKRERYLLLRAATVLAALASVALLVVKLVTPGVANVSGSIRSTGDVTMTFPADGGVDSVSPVCGCDTPYNNQWRGITFAGRTIHISRTGRSPYTQWRLYPGAPTPTLLDADSGRVLQAEVLSLHVTGSFSPAALYSGDDAGIEVLAHEPLYAESIPLMSPSSLNVYLPGPVPIAAWIPFPGAKVKLGGSTSPFPQDQPPLELVEQYGKTLGFEAKTVSQGLQRYPLLDVVGPTALFWTQTSHGSIPGALLHTNQSTNVLAVMVRGGTFSVRMAAEPMTNKELEQLQHYSKEALIVGPEHHDGEPYAITGNSGEYGAGDGGRLSVRLTEPLDQDAYERVTAAVKEQPTAATDLMQVKDREFRISNPKYPTLRFVQLEGVKEHDRYPPLPARDGVNVFGPIGSLQYNQASGSMTINGQSLTVPAASHLELDEIGHLVDPNGRELVTLPLSTGESNGNPIEFSGNGNVRLNGTSKTGLLVRHRTAFSLLLTTFTVLTGILGALQFFGIGRARSWHSGSPRR